VVHFTRGSGQELEAGASLINSFASSSIPKQHLSCPRYPDSCVIENGNSGVIQSCLDCFLDGGPVYRFEYGVSKTVFLAQVRGGTCTLQDSDPPDIVIYRAMYLHQNGFGNYNLFSNNCEDFAIYCKTGYIVERNTSGKSGQVAAWDGVRSASRLAYDHRDMLSNSLCLAVMVGTYCLKRYTADIGVRVDKTKVPVEELAVHLDSSTRIGVDKAKVRVEDVALFLDASTRKKLPVEDWAVYLGSSTGILDKTKVTVEDSAPYLESSTGIHVDKTKAPVEDEAVFLDSSTGKKSPVEDLAVYLDSSTGIHVAKAKVPVEGETLFPDSSTVKKPPVAESSTSQAISRNRSSEKKLFQQHSENCQLVQDVEDVAVFLDSSTAKKPPVEDLAVYLDSSTDIGIDKTKLAVEDVAVFLDSSTGKKQPPVAESSTSQAISGNRSSKKKKKKILQQHRRNCQLVKDVEDVAVFRDSSTAKKPPVEDLAVYLDSSTGIGVDKTKVPVEDVAVFLDSSTGKKHPPVTESPASEAISRNRSSKKQKKKFRQQQRRNCQSVECPIPTGPIPILQGN